jgi:hypothetical protein
MSFQSNLNVLLNTDPNNYLIGYSDNRFYSVGAMGSLIKRIQNVFLVFSTKNAFDDCNSQVVANRIYEFLKNNKSRLTPQQNYVIIDRFRAIKNHVHKQENITELTRLDDLIRTDATIQSEKPEREEPDFLGVTALIVKQHSQLNQFRIWQKNQQWHDLHNAHFDWWMYPLNRTSSGENGRYTVNNNHVEILKKNASFMRDYREGVEILLQAWGWDIQSHTMLSNPAAYQSWPKPEMLNGIWSNHKIRIGKVLDSLNLFGQNDLFREVQLFARDLIKDNKLQPFPWVSSLINL